MIAGWNPIFSKSTGFTSYAFPIQPDFPQNQPATITLNTDSPRKKRKNTPISKYWREGEPVSLMLIMVSHDATWDFIPSLGGGLRGVFSPDIGTLV
jgi:hypothetical protein